ncbi:MAG: hypothetical protein OWT27_00670 [Firmicutes bacterium]|nr:hypothetical protein [Bacillota bacterium]
MGKQRQPKRPPVAPIQPGRSITFRVPRDATARELALLEQVRAQGGNRVSGYLSSFFWGLLRRHVLEQENAPSPSSDADRLIVQFLSLPETRSAFRGWLASVSSTSEDASVEIASSPPTPPNASTEAVRRARNAAFPSHP